MNDLHTPEGFVDTYHQDVLSTAHQLSRETGKPFGACVDEIIVYKASQYGRLLPDFVTLMKIGHQEVNRAERTRTRFDG